MNVYITSLILPTKTILPFDSPAAHQKVVSSNYLSRHNHFPILFCDHLPRYIHLRFASFQHRPYRPGVTAIGYGCCKRWRTWTTLKPWAVFSLKINLCVITYWNYECLRIIQQCKEKLRSKL